MEGFEWQKDTSFKSNRSHCPIELWREQAE